jgi:hypothetical protein
MEPNSTNVDKITERSENLDLNKDTSQKSMGNVSEGYNYDGEEMDRCYICCEMFPKSYIQEHSSECEKNDSESFAKSYENAINNRDIKNCQFCNLMLFYHELENHQKECLKKFREEKNDNVQKYLVSAKDLEETGNFDYMVCNKCEELVSYTEFSRHPCNLYQIELSRQFLGDDMTNKMQKDALFYVQKVSEKKSMDAYNKLLDRFIKLGHNQYTLEKTTKYISLSAPIVIHFSPPKVMKFFVKDTHYRNQFETGTSGGTLSRPTRVGWEDKCFNSIYHDSSDFDRCKYGVLNIVNDPEGVKNCYGYGDSYLTLIDDRIRFRTTFASGDTSGNVELATLEHYCHVLLTYSDNEIKDVISVATGKCPFTSSKNIGQYKEVQFHGPLQFNKDFKALVLNTTYKNNTEITQMAEEFCMANNLEFRWMPKA